MAVRKAVLSLRQACSRYTAKLAAFRAPSRLMRASSPFTVEAPTSVTGAPTRRGTPWPWSAPSWRKFLALVRAGYAPDPLAELQAKIRHAYDLHQLLQQAELRDFLGSAGFAELLAEARADHARNQEFKGKWAVHPLSDAALFSDGRRTWQRLVPTYQGLFRQLVRGPLPTPAAIANTLATIGQRLQSLDTTLVP